MSRSRSRRNRRSLHRAASQVCRVRPRDRDERPPGRHRRRLRGNADVPVEPGGLHHSTAGPSSSSPGAEDPLVHPGSDRTTARTAEKIPPEVVAERIQRQTGLGARTSENFIYKTIKYYLIYTGIPINFGITVFLGFLVGTAIAGQTFYNFTIENLKQFGALKAMGASNLRIVAHDLAPGSRRGSAGLRHRRGPVDPLRLESATGWQGQPTELAFYTPWQLLPITAAPIVLICILSSLLSGPARDPARAGDRLPGLRAQSR